MPYQTHLVLVSLPFPSPSCLVHFQSYLQASASGEGIREANSRCLEVVVFVLSLRCLQRGFHCLGTVFPSTGLGARFTY